MIKGQVQVTDPQNLDQVRGAFEEIKRKAQSEELDIVTVIPDNNLGKNKTFKILSLGEGLGFKVLCKINGKWEVQV